MELFFFYTLTMLAFGIGIAGLVSKSYGAGLLALSGVLFLVTGLVIYTEGLETPDKPIITITKNGSNWDVNTTYPVSSGRVSGSPAWIIQMLYMFVFGAGLILVAIWKSATKGAEQEDEV